jgi:hypothetical protein
MITDEQVKDLVTELTNREFSKYWKKHYPNTPMFVDGQMSDKALERLAWECECSSDVVDHLLSGRVRDVLTMNGIRLALGLVEGEKYLIDIEKENK